jgi:diaminohydroxyphosphoribosylaminopyrimidine deaminase/5-amino-6-(5-phosphoribosylamino)uracil reductase
MIKMSQPNPNMTDSSNFSFFDHEMMTRAITLAKRGQYTTRPNPNVGCVIVDSNNQVVGEGWHERAGEGHAEVHALAQAGGRAKNATAYVTLEPCSHFGRTPPCANALIEAGIQRVICAMVDPNPKVAGNGITRLRDAGVDVQSGLLESDAKAINLGFIQRMTSGRPRITLKMASSLDGRTALSNGVSQWITSDAAREDVQRYRAKSCAILSGSGTVLADNPSLTVRYSELGYLAAKLSSENLQQPTRVILDGRNQLKPPLNVFKNNAPVIVINGKANSLLDEDNIQQVQLVNSQNRIDLQKAMQFLGGLQINDLWIEAGSRLAGAFIQEKLVDQFILYMAPKLMGASSQGLCDLPVFNAMDQVIDLSWQEMKMVGNDLKIVATISE